MNATRAEIAKRLPPATVVWLKAKNADKTSVRFGQTMWVRAEIIEVSDHVSHALAAYPHEVVLCVRFFRWDSAYPDVSTIEFEHPFVGSTTHGLGDLTLRETIVSQLWPH